MRIYRLSSSGRRQLSPQEILGRCTHAFAYVESDVHDTAPLGYQSPGDPSLTTVTTDRPRSRWRLAMIGFAVGAAAPVAIGMYGIHQHNIYIASLGPNEDVCGTGALGAMVMIFVIGPFLGMIGACSGWIASQINWWAAL